ncbi:peptide chain release factor N(5)-glutamine methyltransferase [Sedimenticola selenatireducens]|uniref:Release factor glutamine methyltransferase n=1 Tax=Sedimenticola selenatireducens TaxID=191960 RepID=A0A558DSI9_9GAMM|nr:peptide chain release factor N(5)-glutamine methyltransferase [Sedimenticola selenatireducens]TVO76571.1 peptide chain release factor N(5)-glutamine methyltransferase [Sedimenticola selenatireducens]TVT64015.1 MAG: peptide chain release factor N(5)-glutamine methyltransferase [Sedimenticola selenatireducens]
MISDASQTIAMALSEASQEARASRLEAEVLLAHTLNCSRSHLYTWPEQHLTEQQSQTFSSLIGRRLAGEPIAYITGTREFWSLTLSVTPDTLIPRPETELMVERSLEILQTKPTARIADLGTGSGAIAAALASELPESQITATDNSVKALSVAQANFEDLGLQNIQTSLGHWLTALPNAEPFDLILCNPPYVAEYDPHLQEDGLPWEPASALVSGKDGLDDIRQLIKNAPLCLAPQGWLILEHGFDQGSAVRQLFSEAGYQEVITHHDLEQRERLTEGRRPIDDGNC